MKKILLLITIACASLQIHAQRLYVQYKFNPELQALLENPDKTALYYTYAAQPIPEADRAEYTAIQIRFTDDTGTHEFARYTLSPGRIQQLEFMLLHCAGRMPFVTTEEEFLDLSNSRFAGLTAESFDVISRLVDHVTAIEHDKRLSEIDAFLRALLAQGPVLGRSSLLGLALELTRALDVMDSTALEHDITALALTPAYIATFGQEPIAPDMALGNASLQTITNHYNFKIVMPHWNCHKKLVCENPGISRFQLSANGGWLLNHEENPPWKNSKESILSVFDLKKNAEGKNAHVKPNRALICSAVLRKVNISPDGKNVIIIAHDHKILLWDLTKESYNSECLRTIASTPGSLIKTAEFSPDAKFIVVAERNREDVFATIQYYDINKHCVVKLMRLHDSLPEHIRISPNNRYVAIAGAVFKHGQHTNEICVWDLTKNSDAPDAIRTLTYPGDHINSLQISPDSRFIAIACEHGATYVLDTTKGPEPENVKKIQHTAPAWLLEFSPQSDMLASAADREVFFSALDDAHFNLANPRKLTLKERLTQISFSRSGQFIAFLTGTGLLEIHDRTQPTEHDVVCHVPHDCYSNMPVFLDSTWDRFFSYDGDGGICVLNVLEAPKRESISLPGQLFMLSYIQNHTFNAKQLENLRTIYLALPTAAKYLIDKKTRLSFTASGAISNWSWLKQTAHTAFNYLLGKKSTTDIRDENAPHAGASAVGNAIKGVTPMTLEDTIADLINYGNFEKANDLFELHKEELIDRARAAEFAHILDQWRASLPGGVGSSSSSSTDR